MLLKSSFLFFFLLILSAAQGQSDWELAKEKDGIKVYLRNYKGGRLKEFKAQTTIQANLHQVAALIHDTDHAQQWMSDIISAKILKNDGVVDCYKYYLIAVPFPMQNRDVVYHETMYQDPKDNSLVVRFVGKPDFIKSKDGIVRMTATEGSWIFTPKNNNELLLTYQLYADPEGIPAWIVNMMMVDGPLKTLIRMKEFVKKEYYLNSQFSFIKN